MILKKIYFPYTEFTTNGILYDEGGNMIIFKTKALVLKFLSQLKGLDEHFIYEVREGYMKDS